MTETVITQVTRSGENKYQKQQPAAASSGSCFRRLFCCCFKNDGHVFIEDHSSTAQPPQTQLQPKPDYPLLPPLKPSKIGLKCLVLDLDETLVHSSFKPISNADFVIPVEIENCVHQVYVAKRPGLDYFLRRMAEKFEIVVFTASLSKYADPLMDLLDSGSEKLIDCRLFREACTQRGGNYVKDLSRLGRSLKSVIIVDNSPSSYSLHPGNAIPIGSWFDDRCDRELYDLIPILEAIVQVDDVNTVLDDIHTSLKQKSSGSKVDVRYERPV